MSGHTTSTNICQLCACMCPQETRLVHLVRDGFHPVLAGLHAGDHTCQFCADDGLRSQRFAEYHALRGPSTWIRLDRVFSGGLKIVFYFRHSSTTSLCAVIEQETTIHRSWLKLLRMTCIPLPTFPSVCETGTRTLG